MSCFFVPLADIDECSSGRRCHRNATCQNIIGSYSCICVNGYTGDGINCTGTLYIDVVKSQVEVFSSSV